MMFTVKKGCLSRYLRNLLSTNRIQDDLRKYVWKSALGTKLGGARTSAHDPQVSVHANLRCRLMCAWSRLGKRDYEY